MGERTPATATRTLQEEGHRIEDSTGLTLLVLEPERASVVPLAANGSLVVGRGEDADLRVDAVSVSRRHARLVVAGREVTLTDLGSHNGTLVNGARVEGASRLSPGDLVTIGEASLLLRRERGRARAVREPVSRADFYRRVEDEVERSLRYERSLSVACLRLEAAEGELAPLEESTARELGVFDVAARGEVAGEMLILFPELGGEAAREVAERLLARASLAGRARGGLAAYPSNGGDAGGLCAAARAAAAEAAAGEIQGAEETAHRIEVDGRTIVFGDRAMSALYQLLRRLAASDLPILVCGETGTGKENAARAVHAWSARAGSPFVTLNCAALQDNLIEGELFGHKEGAFTGANTASPGLLEGASGGTVFLDEIGELSASAQAKLLRAIETRRVRRLGELNEREADFRVVAATNSDLETAIEEGRFREDLYFRLNAARVVLPALRDRPRDVPLLARQFVAEARGADGEPPAISDAAMRRLLAHDWPGNVRELKNAIEFALATVDGPVLEPWHLPAQVGGPELPAPPAEEDPGDEDPPPRRFQPIAEELRELERRRMAEALEAAGGVQTKAARLIGMPLRTFVHKLKQYGLKQ